MSRWTHITSCLSVDTFIHDKAEDLLKTVQEYIDKAPKITGSEGDAGVFVNLQSGSNYWTNYDCEHCEYRDTLRDVTEDGKEYQECDAPVGHECSAEYQSCIVISIQGDLRDKDGESTKEEFIKFLEYIEKEYTIRDYSINIEDEFEDESITKIQRDI